MTFKDNFSNPEDSRFVYRQKRVPVFQHKVYNTKEDASSALMADVELVQSDVSGFIFNRLFDPGLMNYDSNYDNEQGNSRVFKDHLASVLDLLISFGIRDKKVVEIGCGKGNFFEMMLADGIDCWGFDPTYVGNNPRIVKEYFTEKNSDLNAEVIIMRHTLEHIPNPFSFVHTIAKANKYRGHLFVEVPTFDWIIQNEAYWDVFYEHCNYFTTQSLGSMFEDAIVKSFFGGQYIYLWADLSKLRTTIPQQQFQRFDATRFVERTREHDMLLKARPPVVVWGAGAKGSTFLNLLDAGREKVSYIVDINPIKQHHFLAGSGHPICDPSQLKAEQPGTILIMNPIYENEIKAMVNNPTIEFTCI